MNSKEMQAAEIDAAYQAWTTTESFHDKDLWARSARILADAHCVYLRDSKVATKFAIVSNLDAHRLVQDAGYGEVLGGIGECVKLFKDKSSATVAAWLVITEKRPDLDDRSFPREPKDVLEDFQAELDTHELFHIFPVIT